MDIELIDLAGYETNQNLLSRVQVYTYRLARTFTAMRIAETFPAPFDDLDAAQRITLEGIILQAKDKPESTAKTILRQMLGSEDFIAIVGNATSLEAITDDQIASAVMASTPIIIKIQTPTPTPEPAPDPA